MSLLQPIVDSARMERLPQRVLLLGVEGVGRSRQLAASSNLYVEVSRSPLLGQTLRALLGEKGGDDAVLAALSAAPALQGVDADRARVSVELLASLVGIQRPDFRTARLDDESRRDGATLELARWVLERAQAGVFVIAFPRLYFGYHYVTDLLGGAVLGFVLTRLVMAQPFPQPALLAFGRVQRQAPVLLSLVVFAIAYEFISLFATTRRVLGAVKDVVDALG
jgi:hypothetical protein